MPTFNAIHFAVTLGLSLAAIGHFIAAVRAEGSSHHRRVGVVCVVAASLALFLALNGAP